LVRQAVHSPRRGVVEQQIAVANLAQLEYTSLVLRLEGTFASTLQVLFGAVAVLAGTFVYFSLPSTFRSTLGQLITVVSLQPAASLMLTFTSLAVVFGRERSRQHVRVRYRTLLDSGDAFPTLIDEIDESIKEARSTLAVRQSLLRLAMRTSGGWFVASLVVACLAYLWWPAPMKQLVQNHFPVAFLSLGILVLVAVFTGIARLRLRWVARRTRR